MMGQDAILVLVTGTLHLAYVMYPNVHAFPLAAGSPASQALTLLMLSYCWADIGLRSWAGIRNIVKLVLMLLLVALGVLYPLAETMLGRYASGPHRYVHDGLIQTEAAMSFLQQGENPYAVSYRGTPMADWPFHEEGLTENPALDHLPYLPAVFLIPWPLRALLHALAGWYDQRCLHLLAFLVCWLAPLRFLSRHRWYSHAVLLALSPLLLPYFLEGRNDVVVLAWLTLATLALTRSRLGLGAAFLAVACTTKATAWFAVPPFAAFLFSREPLRRRWRGAVLVFALVGLAFVLPFFLWSPAAFVQDVLLYQAGHGLHPYPIKGYGLGQLLLTLGLIEDRLAPFPFWLFQFVVGFPTILFVLRYIRDKPSHGRVWLGFGLLLAVFGFFGRAFNDSHLAFTGLILAEGYLMEGGSNGS